MCFPVRLLRAIEQRRQARVLPSTEALVSAIQPGVPALDEHEH